MKKLFFVLFISLIALNSTAITNEKKEENNDPAIVYSLPKTILVVKVKVTETIQEAGPYAAYAESLLGLKNVIKENKTSWELSKVEVCRKGIADPSKSFQIENGFITLNNKGIISGINYKEFAPNKEAEKKNKKKLDSTYEDFLDNSVIMEDQVVTSSIERKAEKAANLIFSLRESRIDLITAESERMPADGEALKIMLKKIDQSERQLLELFMGKTSKKTIKKEFEIIPDKELNGETLFRISDMTGLVDKDDQYGSPVFISLSLIKNTTPTTKINSNDENEGYFYMLPGLAKVTIANNEKEFYKEELEVSQGGSLQKLPCKVLKNKKLKVKYNTKTGALVSVEK